MATGARQTDHLTAEIMEGFGAYLTIDLSERPGVRGRRQKRAMVGMFVSWLAGSIERRDSTGRVITKGQSSVGFRGSDFSLRVALLVHGWHKTDMSVVLAAEKVAEDYAGFLHRHLGKGKRGKRCNREDCQRVTQVDETVRTVYYKFIERCPEIDVLLEMWFWRYVSWLDWVVTVDERGIELTVQEYLKRGQLERARAFRQLAFVIRKNPPLKLRRLPRTRLY